MARFAMARQGGLNEATFVDTAARTIVVIDANANGGWRVDTACGVLPRFALNGLLQSSAQTEASRLDVDLHLTDLPVDGTWARL
jgi:hypothetical protein